jgi:hypothetical protein
MKKILISSGSHTFIQLFGSIIPKLSEEFIIVILIIGDIHRTLPSILIDRLLLWINNGLIQKYIITPDPSSSKLQHHLFMKREVKLLRTYNFDFWFTRCEMQIPDQYIKRCALPEYCKIICYWPIVTYLLFKHQHLTLKILSATNNDSILNMLEKNPLNTSLSNKISIFLKIRIILEKIFNKIKKDRSLIMVSNIILRNIYYLSIKKLIRMITYNLFSLTILPLVMVGKTFKLGPYDEITQIGSGQADAYIFCSELAVEAHKIIYNNPNIYLAQFPSEHICKCHNRNHKINAILCPLTTMYNPNHNPVLIRDIWIVLRETGLKSVHFRKHPGFSDSMVDWTNKLSEHFEEHGIDVKVLESDIIIANIACDYAWVAAPLTSAFLDVLSACKEVVCICFEANSKLQCEDPKLAYGFSEEISWINEDGSYDPKIFESKQQHATTSKSVADIVLELSR